MYYVMYLWPVNCYVCVSFVFLLFLFHQNRNIMKGLGKVGDEMKLFYVL